MHARVIAGARSSGRRNPNNRLTVDVAEATPGAFTGALADAVITAAVTAWQPAAAAFRNDATIALAGRGGWRIPVGHRVWIAGSVESVADGISRTGLGDGVLLSAPDDWSPERVVPAMLATFAANALDQIPRRS